MQHLYVINSLCHFCHHLCRNHCLLFISHQIITLHILRFVGHYTSSSFVFMFTIVFFCTFHWMCFHRCLHIYSLHSTSQIFVSFLCQFFAVTFCNNSKHQWMQWTWTMRMLLVFLFCWSCCCKVFVFKFKCLLFLGCLPNVVIATDIKETIIMSICLLHKITHNLGLLPTKLDHEVKSRSTT